MSEEIIIEPNFYVHVLDEHSGITRLEIGPQTLALNHHEKLVDGTKQMIQVKARHYCTILNPAQIDFSTGSKVVKTDYRGQVLNLIGEKEIRFEQDPFPLYPGEILETPVTPIKVIDKNIALKLMAKQNLNYNGRQYIVGEEWLLNGPGYFIPHPGVEVVGVVHL